MSQIFVRMPDMPDCFSRGLWICVTVSNRSKRQSNLGGFPCDTLVCLAFNIILTGHSKWLGSSLKADQKYKVSIRLWLLYNFSCKTWTLNWTALSDHNCAQSAALRGVVFLFKYSALLVWGKWWNAKKGEKITLQRRAS